MCDRISEDAIVDQEFDWEREMRRQQDIVEAQRIEMLTDWDMGFMDGLGPGDEGCYDPPECFE